MNIYTRKFTELSFPPWQLQIDRIYLNYSPSHPNFAMFKRLLPWAVPLALAVTAATPGWAGAQTADVQPSPTVIPSEIPNSTPISTQPTQPTQSLGSLQINNSLNSLNSASSFYPTTATSGCTGGSQLCFNGSLTNIPGVGTGTNLGFTWSPNQPMSDLQDQAKKNEIFRRNLMRAEANRQIGNDLATAIEQRQYDRARILAIQLVGVKNYRNYLLRITAGQFPNP
jgi:hypothetical protein